jgi:YD repeat-containing protein
MSNHWTWHVQYGPAGYVHVPPVVPSPARWHHAAVRNDLGHLVGHHHRDGREVLLDRLMVILVLLVALFALVLANRALNLGRRRRRR